MSREPDGRRWRRRCPGLAVSAVLAAVVLALAVDGQNTENVCGHPPVPVNAKLVRDGAKATFVCDDGYRLFGSESITCSSNGAWTGDLPFCGTNVAVHKPTNQSTTARGGSPGNANDGDPTTVHDGRRCTETLKEPSPWWSVDLLQPYPVRAVSITTRGCCGHQPLQDIEIRVGNSSAELQRNPLCSWFPGTIEEGTTKILSCARQIIGQHVFLQLVGVEGSLSLCEVEVYSTEEFSIDRCAPGSSSAQTDVAVFDNKCYDFNVNRGASFAEARQKCQATGGDIVHGFRGSASTFLAAELERRKSRLKTQLIWIGAQKEPGLTSRTWKWVNGDVITKPTWGKDQPNNYNGEQNCVVLDGGREWLWNDVGCNLDYLHWICQYTPTTCGSPDVKVNSTIVSPYAFKVSSVIEYVCPEGHSTQGSAKRTCGSNGFWTGSAPMCKYIDCGPLSDIENGSITLQDNGTTTFKSTAKYTCNQNYSLSNGDAKRTCTEDGKWSGRTPQCLFDWCGDPPEVQGATVTATGRKAGSVAVYSCNQGFVAVAGQQELKCGLGGEWSGKPLVCRFVDCGPPQIIENGLASLVNGSTTHGSIVEYTCEQDYWLQPHTSRRQICTKEAKWSADPPTCQLITCQEPEVPAGGYVVGYDFNIHSSIEYHCDPGHKLIGTTTLQCNNNGEWSTTPPECQYIDCGKLTPPVYGTLHYSNDSTHLDSEVKYSCSNNYRLTGTAIRRCFENQAWSGTAPKCEEIRCPEPILPEHSVLSVTGNDRLYGRTLIRTSSDAVSTSTYKIGALVKYRCERGYKVVGEPISNCDDTGSWTGVIPQCVYVDCGTPESIDNGKFNLVSNVTYYGSAVLYECDDHFQLDGHGRRLCLENGTWSSETPKCQEINCDELKSENNLLVRMASRTVGGIAEYTCPRGYFTIDNTTRQCLPKGSWSGRPPTCQMVDCKHPGPIENGRVIIMNDTTTYNSAAEYHCVPHFQRMGPYMRKCLDDAQWSGEQPYCQLISAAISDTRTLGLAVTVGGGIVLFLVILLALIYLRLKRPTPVKNTENVEGAVRKEEQNTAVMSYASLSDVQNHIYDSVTDYTYDEPNSYYEPSPVSKAKSDHSGATVTINGVAIR